VVMTDTVRFTVGRPTENGDKKERFRQPLLLRPRDGMGRRGREREVILRSWMTKHDDYLRRPPNATNAKQSLCFHQ